MIGDGKDGSDRKEGSGGDTENNDVCHKVRDEMELSIGRKRAINSRAVIDEEWLNKGGLSPSYSVIWCFNMHIRTNGYSQDDNT